MTGQVIMSGRKRPETTARECDGAVSASAPAASAQDHRAGYDRRLETLARWLLVFAAAALLVSPRFPYWRMKLSAPQYPKGLYLVIYPNQVLGDVREIDGLNHYIGMRKIDDAAVLERRWGVPAIVFLAACLVVAALWRSRWAVLLVVPVIVFPPLFFGDLYWWLRDSGLHLDPKAALSSSIKPFVPQVLGSGKIAQFRTEATLGTGYYLSLFAVGASVCFCYARLRRAAQKNHRRRARARGRAGSQLVRSWGLSCSGGRSRPTRWSFSRIAPARRSRTPWPERRMATRSWFEAACILARSSFESRCGSSGKIDRSSTAGGRARWCGSRPRPASSWASRSAPAAICSSARTSACSPRRRTCASRTTRLNDVLFGVYLRRAPRSVICGNRLHGKDFPVPRRGDLIRVWYSDDVTVEANTAVGGRNVVLWYSNHLTIRGNRISGGRYGLHFMYCHDANIAGNLLRDNSVGAFLMYSERLRLHQNWIASNRGVSGYGVGLKDMDDCQLSGNVLAGNKAGIFLENSRGAFADNLLAGNDKGIVIFPSAMGNRFEANTFLDNGEQVVIEGFAKTMTTNTWRGNFWSDYRGYDRDGDGRGDLAYRPVRLFERLSDRNPALRLFADNPSRRPLISPRGCSRSSSRSRSLLTTVRSCVPGRHPS